MKIAFLDRDGTINLDYPDNQWKNRTIPELISGSIEGMRGLRSLGFEIIIVTNQYIINDGIITTDEYIRFTSNLLNILNKNGIEILDIFYCPHNDLDNCSCKKPNTGMIDQAISKYPSIDLSKSIVIGDSVSDMTMAKRLEIDFYGVNGKDFYDGLDSIYEVLSKLAKDDYHD